MDYQNILKTKIKLMITNDSTIGSNNDGFISFTTILIF
jgi:hypothetical protein